MLHVGVDPVEEPADGDIRHVADALGDRLHILHAHLPHDRHVIAGRNRLDAFFNLVVDASGTLRAADNEHGLLARRKFGRTGKRIAIGQLAHRVSEHHALFCGEELRRGIGGDENRLRIARPDLVRDPRHRILFLQVDRDSETAGSHHDGQRHIAAGSDDHVGVHLLHDALRAHQRLRKLEGKCQILEERAAVQRFRRDIFIRPVGRHETFLHGILATRKRDIRVAHLLQAFGNRHRREDMATGATAYKQELFHDSALVISKPPNV